MSVASETGIESTIFRTFEELASSSEAPAVYDDGRVVRRHELLTHGREIARELRSRGLRRGDVVAVQMRNSTELLALLVACFELRITILPIDRDARTSERETITGLFGARGLVTDGSHGEAVISTLATGEARSCPEAALIKLTSGSTGKPRGVLTTEENLIADCTNICETMGIREDDVNLGAIPFSHSYGFSNLVTPLLLQGTAIVVSNDYMPLSLLRLANEFGVTFVPGIPMIYDHLSRLPDEDGSFETVRTFISAGAPLPPPVARAFRERHGASIHTFYGCSECGGISYDRLGGAAERGTVGAPMRNVRVEIDTDGRLAVRSGAVAAGYLEGTAADSARFTNGRFLTDDLCELTEDREIRITGRTAALINIAGKKVNPREVENVILGIEGVRQVAVFGISGGARGEIIHAAVVADDTVTRQMVRNRCLAELSAHKVPRVVRLLDALPLDERGKLKRSELEGSSA